VDGKVFILFFDFLVLSSFPQFATSTNLQADMYSPTNSIQLTKGSVFSMKAKISLKLALSYKSELNLKE